MTDSTKFNPTAWCNVWACCQHLKCSAACPARLVGRTFCSRGYVQARGCLPFAQFTLRAGQWIEYSRSTNTSLPRNVNVKVTFSVSTPRRCIGIKEVYLHSFLTSALDGGEWLTSFPGNFIWGKYLIYFSMWAWVGLCPDSNPGPSKPVASCYVDQGTPTLSRNTNQPNNSGRKLLFLTLRLVNRAMRCTGLFVSPSGISELDCATTKTDTAERSISIGRESLQVFFLY